MQKGKKFGRYLAKNSQVRKQAVDYCSVYETLDKDIREFNCELEFFNKKNKAMSDRLIATIEHLITGKFPGGLTRARGGGLRQLQNGAGDALVGHRLGAAAPAGKLLPGRHAEPRGADHG